MARAPTAEQPRSKPALTGVALNVTIGHAASDQHIAGRVGSRRGGGGRRAPWGEAADRAHVAPPQAHAGARLGRVRPAGVGLAEDRGLGATHRPTSRGGRPRGAPRARGGRLGGQPRRATEPPRVPAVMLVDTSAWIELLRATGHPAHVTLRYHLERRSPIAPTEPIIMELLAGTRSGGERAGLPPRLIPLPPFTLRGLAPFESAARLYPHFRSPRAT